MKLIIINSKKHESAVEIKNNATLTDLKKIYLPHVCVYRKTFKLVFPDDQKMSKAVTLGDDKILSEYGVQDGSRVQYKDLGPQIGYRTVFVAEYAGPIALIGLYAMRPSFIYGPVGAPLSNVQCMYVMMFIAHFLKREFETFFVHKFSRPTMPLSNLFKNCTYYWSFAASMGYYLCHPLYTEPKHGLINAAAVAWGLFELANLAVHLQLSGMRKNDGDTARNLPKGPLFSLVTCPNYTFEALGWVAYSVGTNIAMSWVFTLVGLAQMTQWAIKKRQGYAKADPTCKKKSIIPFVV